MGRRTAEPLFVDAGRRLRGIRLERGLSVRATAELAGMAASHLSGMELGKRRLTERSVKALARVLKVDPSEIDPDHNTPPASAPIRAPAAASGVYQRLEASRIAGVTERQLDHWVRTGVVEATIGPPAGSGRHRLFSSTDVVKVVIIKRLIDTGIAWEAIRAVMEYLRWRSVQDMAGLVLVYDGATVHACGSVADIPSLPRAGQGFFGIEIGALAQEITQMLTTMNELESEAE